jgi:glycosyltransferase involved in cell wall biosynthesis
LTTRDLVLVLAARNRGWILDRVCREIATRAPGRVAYHDGESPLPPADTYFFSHFSLFLALRRDPSLRGARSLVLFTHPSYPRWRAPLVAWKLRAADHVLSMSSTYATALARAGLPRGRLRVVPLGADPERYPPHERGSGAIGLCGMYYRRKAPDRIAALVRALPHRQFVLMGRGWEEAPVWTELATAPNFSYRELSYDALPSFYAGIDVFVSLATIEGGPVPMLESMLANAVPVATRTGWAPDLIEPGRNGFLLDVDASVETAAEMVERARGLRGDVRATVAHLTWERFARDVLSLVT